MSDERVDVRLRFYDLNLDFEALRETLDRMARVRIYPRTFCGTGRLATITAATGGKMGQSNED